MKKYHQSATNFATTAIKGTWIKEKTQSYLRPLWIAYCKKWINSTTARGYSIEDSSDRSTISNWTKGDLPKPKDESFDDYFSK